MNIIANIDFPALGQLMVVSKCACPGRELRLLCTVVGGGNTIWRGTAFDHTCRSGKYNEIVLRHSKFESGREIGECNDGTIIGRSLNRTLDGSNFIFTSQLVIHLPLPNATNDTLEGKTVDCIYDDGLTASETNTIGTHTITFIREGTSVFSLLYMHVYAYYYHAIDLLYNHAASPPATVHVAQVTTNALTFQWEHGVKVCPVNVIGYKVNATNCGVCPNTTFSPSVTCVVSSVFNAYGNKSITCALSVETTVCGTNTGNTSNTVMAILKGMLKLCRAIQVLHQYAFHVL